MKKKYMVICFISILVFSCSNDFFLDSMRPDKLPEITKPSVNSFKMENQLEINWQQDDVADEYVLYRDTNPKGGFSKTVYEGTDLSYTDGYVTGDTFYYYKLAKKQGKKEFPKSEYAIGACKDIKKDGFEDNNTKETATELVGINTDANIFYYKDYQSAMVIEDKDWYKVTLPPMKRQVLGFHKVIEGGFLNSGELFFNVEYGMPQDIIDYTTNEDTYMVENTDYVTKTLYFQISINKTMLTPDMSGSYTKFGSYTIVRQRTEVITNF